MTLTDRLYQPAVAETTGKKLRQKNTPNNTVGGIFYSDQ